MSTPAVPALPLPPTPPITWYDRLNPHTPRAIVVTVLGVDPATTTCLVDPYDGDKLAGVTYYGGVPEVGSEYVALMFDGSMALIAGGGGSGATGPTGSVEEVVIQTDEPPYTPGLELWVDLDAIAAKTQEVWVGALVPPLDDIELWYDTNAMPTTRAERAGEPGVLKVRDPNNPGVWTELASASGGSGGGGADEVWVDTATPVEPGLELWIDPSVTPPPVVDEVAIQTGEPDAMAPSVEIWIDTDEPFTQPTGPAGPAGADGAMGATGPTGPMGVSTVIIGSYGDLATPADLPVDGAIPVDWDGPGKPAVAYQVELGESLYFDHVVDPPDPLDGHLFQYVGVGIDPAGWIDVGLIQGPAGPSGATGPAGVEGPSGPAGPAGIPAGGTAHQGLLKLSDTDGDAGWRDVIRRGTGHGLVDQVISGGLSIPDAKIKFGSRLGPLIDLYGGIFGFGIESGQLVAFVPAANKVSFRAANTTGAEWASISASGLGPATNTDITWLNGFSGTAQFRVNPAAISLCLEAVKKSTDTASKTRYQLFTLPAGVPAPWRKLWQTVTIRESDNDSYYTSALVQVEAGGVYLQITNDNLVANSRYIDCIITWAR